MPRIQRLFRLGLIWIGAIVISGLAALFILFPGRQAPMALTLATGIGIPALQARVDALEDQAIHGQPFTDGDKRFLTDLYTCFAQGGRLTYVLRQSAQMMRHYLGGDGGDLHVEPRIFLLSSPVHEQMILLRQKILEDQKQGTTDSAYSTDTFYMGDQASIEAVTGLYYGTLNAKSEKASDGSTTLHWSVEMPWHWPSYEFLHQKFGDYHAQCFPIPNARSLLQGPQHCLWIDDGLGEHLVHLGLAKPFVVRSAWSETLP